MVASVHLQTTSPAMWSKLFLCALVGIAAASNYGWQDSKEYVYQVRGRTFTGLHDVANHYSGIVIKAKLHVHPQSDGSLIANLASPQYSQIHAHLPDGWKSEIPESKLHYQQLELSQQPFKIVMKNGVVKDIVVSSEVHNWEANMIKGIVSQLQLDTNGENVIKAHINQLPEDDDNSAVFKTMEDTVTGTFETLYDIAPLPEYVWQAQPWIVPMPELKGDGEFIEIVKSKNFSRAEERLGYYYGLGGMGDFEPNTNHMGDFFLRSSVSRAILSGSLKRYTIQSSATTNKIIVSPTLNSEQKGMVVSHLNLTLDSVQQASGSVQRPQQPKKLGSLTYTFNTPFSGEHEARQGSQRQEQQYLYSSEEERVHYRQRRSASNKQNSGESESVGSSEEWAQEEAQLSQPPHSPLLPLYIGYKGKSVKNAQQVDVVEATQKLARQIASDLEKTDKMHEELTLSKYAILTSVARIMSHEEIQQVAQKLYTNEKQGQRAHAWKAYRDAIAEAGTGPALLSVEEWIKNKKIEREEAAEVIASVAYSVRQPTEEYMRAFFNLALKEHEVVSQPILNDTAILTFCTLARKVYVDKQVAHNQFPIHSFGKFRTQKGEEFVAQELIPHLKEKLNAAVQQGDSHKVLVYIRALGNVAHQKILAAFEPYLEGDKQISQFQRWQMVVAMDKLVRVHPKVARSVLYKIYQNSGETTELRVAAVYQLIRTAPPASMLQRMAQYTHVDEDEQVNAAVISVIESACEMEGEEFAELVENARAAQPLLNKQEYGNDYSTGYLRSYVQNEMNLYYEQAVETHGSHDSSFAKGIKYGLRAGIGGANLELINAQAMVSSVDELTNVFQRQTKNYQEMQQQQQQHYGDAKNSKWSSESIAQMLNLKSDEREQLEGNLLLQVAGGATRYFAFNNRTIEMMPELVSELEDLLRQGKDIDYTKFLNRYEIVLSFPTEMSLPFIYTLNAPTLLHLRGQVQATAQPQISNGNEIRKPESIKARAEIRAVVSSRTEAKIGFVTPFDHQKYVSGYDKNMFVNIPVKTELEYNIKKQQAHIQMQPLNPGQDETVFHYSTYPYTAKKDILRLRPVAEDEQNMKILYNDDENSQTEYNTVIGKKSGMAFKVHYKSEDKFVDAYSLYEHFNRHDGVSALIAPFFGENVQHTKINIKYSGKDSSARKVDIHLAHKQRYESGEGQGPKPEISKWSQLPREQEQRQEEFMKMAQSGIKSVQAQVCDASIKFDGPNNVEYSITSAVAKSAVDEKARVLFYYRKHSANHHESKPYEVAIVATSRAPNTNELDFQNALKFDPTTSAKVDLAFGENYESAAKMHIDAELHQSEDRKKYLQNHPRAQECREEIQEGNKQMPACANMTHEANILDRVSVKIQYDNFDKQDKNCTRKLYNAVRYLGYFNMDENTVDPEGSGKQNEIRMQARFEPDFEGVNVTIKGEHISTKFDNIRLGSWGKQVFGIHPVYRLHSRVESELLGLDTYLPYCVVDKNSANTFDNKTYPIELDQDWTVMMQYAPEYARKGDQEHKYQEQQKRYQLEQYLVLARESGNNGKDIKVTLRTPKTEGQLVEVDFKPSGSCSEQSPCAKVTVNKQQIKISDEQAEDLENGKLKIYALPNGEVKMEVRDAFEIIYDGKRAKIQATHDKLRGAVRGLCGTFTGEEYSDFLTPKNCLLREPQNFVDSWSTGQKGQQQQQHRGQSDSEDECIYEDITYANVISDQDAGRSHQEYSRRSHQGSRTEQHHQKQSQCTKQQTRYQVQQNGDEICFTIRPLPICGGSCSASRIVEKNVQVHCVQKSNVSAMWKKQIQNGASPDFSHKSASKSIRMEVPESCVRY